MPENENPSFTAEEKEAASFLRERFLLLIASLPAKPCKIGLFQKAEATAQIRAFDQTFENVIVEDLKPPNTENIISKGILRTSDILTITYENI
ncbi:unnamed protein product [Ceutorhynchus assimilis]|uniref:Gem-associated protein 7 n=1 Tax=Ceutorhynchus assimilis TaxID=467358 RepID=A0A9N9MZL1_9CUCU|nr:unnamed protein product [Ceutorhynchus assimilis]